jgi:hypothetical protein
MPSVTARAKISASGPVSPSSLADDVLSGLKGLESFGFAGPSMHVFSWTLTALGRGPELEAALTGFTIPWTQAAIAFAAGDPFGAAEICAEIGARTEEAYARLFAARMLLAEGRRAVGDEQLHSGVEFYRSVGATHYIGQGESLLAASA